MWSTLLALALLAEPAAAAPVAPVAPGAEQGAPSPQPSPPRGGGEGARAVAAEGGGAAPVQAEPPGAEQGAVTTAPPRPPPLSEPRPLPPPPSPGYSFTRPEPGAPAPSTEVAPREVAALLAPGRTLVEARKVDLDLDGSPEWILVASYQHPTRIDNGPRSAEWRPGQRIESKATHELVIVRRVGKGWKARFTAELRGNERQPLFVERLATPDLKRGRWPVVVTGARACSSGCGPVQLQTVAWSPDKKAFVGSVWGDTALALLPPTGTVEVWRATRRPGDPPCCPSGYSVRELVLSRKGVALLRQRTVAADQLRRLLPPGGLIARDERAGAPEAPPPAKPPARPRKGAAERKP